MPVLSSLLCQVFALGNNPIAAPVPVPTIAARRLTSWVDPGADVNGSPAPWVPVPVPVAADGGGAAGGSGRGVYYYCWATGKSSWDAPQ